MEGRFASLSHREIRRKSGRLRLSAGRRSEEGGRRRRGRSFIWVFFFLISKPGGWGGCRRMSGKEGHKRGRRESRVTTPTVGLGLWSRKRVGMGKRR